MKLKRFWFLAVLLCLALCVIPVSAAEGGSCGEDVSWTLKDGVLTISGSGAMADYQSYEDTPWTEVRKTITSIVIQPGITAIGTNAFHGCSNATSVSIPASVQTIGPAAFYGCKSVKSFTIPDGVTVIQSCTFSSCTGATNITIPQSVTEIETSAFLNCKSLTSITLPQGLERIGSSAFRECSALTEVTLPENLTWIGDLAFYECYALTSIVIPDSVTHVGRDAFFDCNALTTAVVGDGIQEIPRQAFFHCGSLESVELGKNVTSVGSNAFGHCLKLKTINLPDSITQISAEAFINCRCLENLRLPKKLTHIDVSTFASCVSLKRITVPEGVQEIDHSAFCDCTALEQVVLPQSLKILGYTVFEDCDALTTLTIPAGVTSIGYGIVEDCNNLTAVYFEGGVPEFHKNTFYDNTLMVYCPATWDDSACQNYGGTLTWLTYTPAPHVTASNAPNGKVKLTWPKVEGAVKYQIYRCARQNGRYGLMNTVTGTTCTNKTAVAGKGYYYYVVAIAADGTRSQPSETVYRVCDLPRPVVKASNDAATGKVQLSWNAVEGAVSYTVYRATSKYGTYYRMKTVTGTTYLNNSAKAGKLYYYKVVANAAKSNASSARSVAVYRTCDLAQPTMTVSLNGNGKPVLSWAAIPGAVKYQVYRSTAADGKFTFLKTVTGTSMTNFNAKPGMTYYYKVIAICANTKGNSAFSPIISVKT